MAESSDEGSLLLSDTEEILKDGEIRESSKPRGKPKSGRPWKSVKHKYSGIVKVKPLNTSWETKMKSKKEIKNLVQQTRDIKDAAKKAKQDKWDKIKERKKREEENAKKAEVVQPIRNTAKIKRMKRKQLRMIEKR